MFDLFAMLLSSITSFLFPIFASYKALKSSDPAELTPWLMYWVVFNCCLLAESWVYFIVSWIPFYGYFRLFFFLYLILPQTQGARLIYEEKIHPFLAENEGQIDEFIASAHNRLTAAGVSYLKLAIEYVRTQFLGLPPSQPSPPEPEPSGPQSYTQSLLSRFSVPAAKWAAPGNAGATDFYSLLSGAVAAATGAGASASSTAGSSREVKNPDALIPSHLRDSGERMDFIAAQRERLNVVLSALDREAQDIQRDDGSRLRDRFYQNRAPSMTYDGPDEYYEQNQRPPSGSGASAWSGISKSRSEVDFEKIEAESSSEDDPSIRRRNVSGPPGSSWSPWGWGGAGDRGEDRETRDRRPVSRTSSRREY